MLTGSFRWVGTVLAAVLIAFLTACAPEAPKEPIPPKGWRFVPHRDENNLIVEIIATPLT